MHRDRKRAGRPGVAEKSWRQHLRSHRQLTLAAVEGGLAFAGPNAPQFDLLLRIIGGRKNFRHDMPLTGSLVLATEFAGRLRERRQLR